MIWELIYTSLEHGLFNDSSGFGTAAATSGMPAAVSDILAAGSGYDAVFPLHSPDYKLNPVADFHYTVTIGNALYHWVGRSSAAGVDYSGRSNMLAHHLLIHENAVGSALPENLLDESSAAGLISLGKFSGPARWLKPVPKLPDSRVRPPAKALLWEKYFGDSGWAGILARQVLTGGAPVYIVFKKGWEVKDLLDEAIALLPPNLHWQVTYNTYFTGIAAGAGCGWRFCYEDSPVLAGVRQKNVNIVIDGTQPPPDDPWCTFARGEGTSPLSKKSTLPGAVLLPEGAAAAGVKTANPESGPKVTFRKGASFRIRVSNGNAPEKRGIHFDRIKDYLLPVLLLVIAAAGIIWMLFSSGSEPPAELPPAAEPAVKRNTSAEVVKRRVRHENTGALQRGSEPAEKRPEEEAPEKKVSGESISERGKKVTPELSRETVPLKTSASNPLTVHPDELKKLAGKITEKAFFGIPGNGDMIIELPSSLRPEVRIVQGVKSVETDTGFALADKRGEICRFIAPAADGNWQILIVQNFLPGAEGFDMLAWAAADSEASEMYFDDCIRVTHGTPGSYDENGEYLLTVSVPPEERESWNRLAMSGRLSCKWDAESCRIGIVVPEFENKIAELNDRRNWEISQYQKWCDEQITANEQKLREWQNAANDFNAKVKEAIREKEKKGPRRPPRMDDSKEYNKAYRFYLRAHEKWNKEIEKMKKEFEEDYAEFQKEITAYTGEIERLKQLKQQIPVSEELQKRHEELQKEFENIVQEWCSRESCDLYPAAGSRYIKIVFSENQ